MVPTTISAKQLAKFKDIRDRFIENTPKLDAEKWRSMSNEAIWLRVVSQVVVVGKSGPEKRLQCADIKASLAFHTLANLRPRNAAYAIGPVLAEIGVRFVSQEHPAASPKTNALVKNLAFLKAFDGGPRGFVEQLAGMATSRDRIDYISKNLYYFKEKGARDFLTTGLGMATDVIALDSRVMGIVKRIVPKLPDKLSRRNYDSIENFLIEQVCHPLGMTAAQFDQLLYRNKTDIEKYYHGGRQRRATVLSSCSARGRLAAKELDCRHR